MSQGKNHPNAGFTLVEVMVAIVIIVLLSQMGNILGLLQSRDRGELEGISVGILTVIESEKIDALLGKTKNKEIVRKRKISIMPNGANLEYASRVNLASKDEISYEPATTFSTSLQKYKVNIATCPGSTDSLIADSLATTALEIVFTGGEIKFFDGTTTEILKPHVVISIGDTLQKREIHIDKRTGLTYERIAPDVSQISCQ